MIRAVYIRRFKIISLFGFKSATLPSASVTQPTKPIKFKKCHDVRFRRILSENVPFRIRFATAIVAINNLEVISFDNRQASRVFDRFQHSLVKKWPSKNTRLRRSSSTLRRLLMTAPKLPGGSIESNRTLKSLMS